MSLYLIRFYMATGEEMNDIVEAEDLRDIHEKLTNCMREQAWYELGSASTDSYSRTIIWMHVAYFDIEFSGHLGTQPIHLHILEEEE